MRNDTMLFYTDDDREDLDFFMMSLNKIDAGYYTEKQINCLDFSWKRNNTPTTPYITLDINIPQISVPNVLIKLRKSENLKFLPTVTLSTANYGATIKKNRILGASFCRIQSYIFKQFNRSVAYALAIKPIAFAPDNKILYTTISL